jgi:hypothetical protein
MTRNLMAEMKLLGMLNAFDKTVTDATRDQVSYTEFLDALLQAEADYRGERAAQRRLKAAKLPVRVCLDDFDYTAHRSITKTQIREPAESRLAQRGATAAHHRADRRRQVLHRPSDRAAGLSARPLRPLHERHHLARELSSRSLQRYVPAVPRQARQA